MNKNLRLVASLVALLGLPALADDAFEENDTYQTAAPIGPGTYDGLQADDIDWYSIDVSAGGALRVAIEFSGRSGDLDMALVSPALEVVERSQGSGDRESVEVASPVRGKYLVAVYGYQGARAAYRMIVEAAGSGDDGFEENDTAAAAARIDAGNHDLVLRDDDWFRVALRAGQSLSADILFRHAGGDLDLALHAADGSRLAVSESTKNQESVTYTAAASGDVLLRAYGYQGATGDYELRLRVSAPAPGTPGPTTQGDPLERGPHAVGEVRGTIFDSVRQKNVEVILHYPATSNGVGTAIDRAGGPHSLVSHGHGRFGAGNVNPPNMLGWNYYYEHLASHGFFVIAPNLDVNSIAPEPPGQHKRQILENSADMKYCLTFMLDSSRSSSGSFSGTVDSSKVAISGHSRGGEASLHVGQTDSRVKAVVSIAPTDFHGFTYRNKPILLWNATHDCDVVSPTQQAIFDRWSGDMRLITVVGGGHFLWTDTAGPICSVPLPRRLQHDVTKHYVLSFLDTRLRGNDDYRDAWNRQIANARIQQK